MQASPFAAVGPSFEEEQGHVLDAFRQGPQGLLIGSGSRGTLDESLLQAVAAAPPGRAGYGGSGSSLLRSTTISDPLNVAELLGHTNLLAAGSGALATGAVGVATSSSAAAGRVAWVQPSGRRQTGEGCEEVEQAVLLAMPTPTGGATLRITLLAAGFCIGPSGASIRDLCKATQTDIKSWTAPPDEHCARSCRVFRVEGPRHGVAQAVAIICDAVDRYKELCEGKYAGQAVPRIQHVGGVDFHYQPPPRQVVPFAASLKGQSSSRRQGSGRPAGGKPPSGPYQPQRGRGSSSRASSLGPPSASAVQPPLPTLARSTSLPGPKLLGSHKASLPPPHLCAPPATAAPLSQCSANHSAAAPASDSSCSSSASSSRCGPETCTAPGGSAHSMATLAHTPPSRGYAISPVSPIAEDEHSRQEVAPPGKFQRSGCEAASGAQHAERAAQDGAAVLAPTHKLDKDAVMSSVFGGEAASGQGVPEPPTAPVHHPAEIRPPHGSSGAGSFDMGLLLQQLALHEAQEQAAASLAAAVQQGVRGGYELSEAGVLLPASLSPLARPPGHLPPMSAFDAHLAAQGLANSADVLTAVAAAWQNAQHAQAQQAAAADLLLQQLAGAGLLGSLAGPGAASGPASDLTSQGGGEGLPAYTMAAPAPPAAGLPTTGLQALAPAGYGAPHPEDRHMPLSTFQPPFFTPFATVGSPPGSSRPRSPDAPPTSAFAAAAASPQAPSSSPGADHPPTTPPQPRAAPAAMHTPPGVADRSSEGAARTGSPSSASALDSASRQGWAGLADGPALRSSAGGSAFGSFLSLHGEGGGEAGGLFGGGAGIRPSALFPAGHMPPLPVPALARAASVPGPQGSYTPMDRLDDMVALARANSYAGSGGPAGGASAGTDLLAPASGHSAFSSALADSPWAGGAPAQLASRHGAGTHASGVLGDVDRLLDAMF